MSYKTRGNYAPGFALTKEEFNKIFEKDEDANVKPTNKKDTTGSESDCPVEQTTESVPSTETE